MYRTYYGIEKILELTPRFARIKLYYDNKIYYLKISTIIELKDETQYIGTYLNNTAFMFSLNKIQVMQNSETKNNTNIITRRY
jgi:hypothetical protein